MDFSFIIVFILIVKTQEGNIEEDEYGVKFASDCEVCKLVTREVVDLLKSGSSSDVIETGYNMDSKAKKRTKYNKSELRLVEVLEETCEGMSDYRVHKEKMDSTRWAKTMSQTFRTLHKLVNKGVKVDLGIPMELWDEPSAEVAQLKTQCEQFLEDNEDSINDWYFGEQMVPLQDHVCKPILADDRCLSEPFMDNPPSASEDDSGEQKGDYAKAPKSRTEL